MLANCIEPFSQPLLSSANDPVLLEIEMKNTAMNYHIRGFTIPKSDELFEKNTT